MAVTEQRSLFNPKVEALAEQYAGAMGTMAQQPFTADAVRAAGGGDIDADAEVMENVMENLEQGGQVSEEAQGLEGARNMFATAQRLEGVL